MSKRILVSLVAAVGLSVSISNGAFGAERCLKEEAKAMAEKAVAAVKAGADKAYGEFTQKDNATWRNKDCYVFVVKYDGVVSAHGGNPALVGKNVTEIKDSDGEPFMKKMIDQAKKGTGWVDYKWSNPTTKAIEPKTTYVLPLQGMEAFVGVGIYK